MSEINDSTSSDHLCGTNCTAGLDFDDSTGDEWDQLKIVAIVIPIVILLLTAVIVAIYCFKKKADKAEQANKEINDRLPVIWAQNSTCSNDNRKSTKSLRSRPIHQSTKSLPSPFESYSKMEYSNKVYDPKFGHQVGGTNCTAADVSSDDTMHYGPIIYGPMRPLTIYDRYPGYQLGGTNCTAAVTNFERSSDCYSDSYSECQPEPDRGTCSVSE